MFVDVSNFQCFTMNDIISLEFILPSHKRTTLYLSRRINVWDSYRGFIALCQLTSYVSMWNYILLIHTCCILQDCTVLSRRSSKIRANNLNFVVIYCVLSSTREEKFYVFRFNGTRHNASYSSLYLPFLIRICRIFHACNQVKKHNSNHNNNR